MGGCGREDGVARCHGETGPVGAGGQDDARADVRQPEDGEGQGPGREEGRDSVVSGAPGGQAEGDGHDRGGGEERDADDGERKVERRKRQEGGEGEMRGQEQRVEPGRGPEDGERCRVDAGHGQESDEQQRLIREREGDWHGSEG